MKSDHFILSSRDVWSILETSVSKDVEEFWILGLSSCLLVLDHKMLFRGTVDQCLVHPRDVFKFACGVSASALIAVHNHPRGEPLPSPQDIKTTCRLFRLSKMMGIPLIDHIIFGAEGYRSFADEGWKPFH